MPRKLPKVVIVGRPNVGKSSLFNQLSKRTVSIVDPTAGVTRDRVGHVIELPPIKKGQKSKWVELVDTGGYGVEDPQISELSSEVERQIAYGLGEAALIIFVIDAQAGLTPLDEEIAQLIRAGSGPAHTRGAGGLERVVLVANKVDSEKYEANAWEAMTMGFGEPVMVSASTGYNKMELVEGLRAKLDTLATDAPTTEAEALAEENEPETGPLIAMVGKRNAGKSTLTNALAGEPRVIVSEVEGTTRDSVDVYFEIDGKPFTAIDTAGVRKRKSLQDDLEYYSYHRSLRSIRRADVVLFLVDATVPISQVDRQLSTEIAKHHKPVVIVVNKWDLVDDEVTEEDYLEYLDKELMQFSYAPIIFISAKDGEGVRDVVAMAMNLHEQAGARVTTGELNTLFETIINSRPPHSKLGKRARIYYVSQVAVHPPTIALFVNIPELFDPAYQRFLLNRLRDEVPYSEVPIQLVFRSRSRLKREDLERRR